MGAMFEPVDYEALANELTMLASQLQAGTDYPEGYFPAEGLVLPTDFKRAIRAFHGHIEKLIGKMMKSQSMDSGYVTLYGS